MISSQNLLSDLWEDAKEKNLIRICGLVLLSLGGLGDGAQWVVSDHTDF